MMMAAYCAVGIAIPDVFLNPGSRDCQSQNLGIFWTEKNDFLTKPMP